MVADCPASSDGIPPRLPGWAAAALVLALLPGCSAGRASVAPVIRRATCPPPITREWNEWACHNIQSGDIVFRLGNARAAFGLFDLSEFAARLTHSPYSHTGIASVEGGAVYIYDVTRAEGVRRIPFADFICDASRPFGIRRLRSEYQHHVPAVIEYCRWAYETNVPFDDDFLIDNDSLYCAEMTEMAFRHSGLEVSQPVPIQSMPNFANQSTEIRLVQVYSGLRPEQPVYIPGNDSIGLWSCPRFVTVYEGNSPHELPYRHYAPGRTVPRASGCGCAPPPGF